MVGSKNTAADNPSLGAILSEPNMNTVFLAVGCGGAVGSVAASD
jgi:hypothetical protein